MIWDVAAWSVEIIGLVKLGFVVLVLRLRGVAVGRRRGIALLGKVVVVVGRGSLVVTVVVI